MVKSMTAYAMAEKSDRMVTVSVEIRTYNSRSLDMSLRLPPGCAGFEEKVRNLISAHLVRGRVELRLVYKDLSDATHGYELDLAKARAYMDVVQQLARAVNMPSALVSLDHLAALPGMITALDNTQLVQNQWPLMADCVSEALLLLDQMRCREGDFIGQDLAQRLDGIESQLLSIEAATEGLLALYRDKLQVRIDTLTQGLPALEPIRLAQEAALLADRSDISEEIVRARSHIAQFRSIMIDAEPSGRKLNFLLQEFNREFNTMGSKAGQAAVAHTIVDVKTEIEKLREQVQNIE